MRKGLVVVELPVPFPHGILRSDYQQLWIGTRHCTRAGRASLPGGAASLPSWTPLGTVVEPNWALGVALVGVAISDPGRGRPYCGRRRRIGTLVSRSERPVT
jgi:hypothetical protein